MASRTPAVQLSDATDSLVGEIITIGADAHGPDKIAYAFDKAADILADCGFTYYTVFKDRKPEFIKL